MDCTGCCPGISVFRGRDEITLLLKKGCKCGSVLVLAGQGQTLPFSSLGRRDAKEGQCGPLFLPASGEGLVFLRASWGKSSCSCCSGGAGECSSRPAKPHSFLPDVWVKSKAEWSDGHVSAPQFRWDASGCMAMGPLSLCGISRNLNFLLSGVAAEELTKSVLTALNSAL